MSDTLDELNQRIIELRAELDTRGREISNLQDAMDDLLHLNDKGEKELNALKTKRTEIIAGPELVKLANAMSEKAAGSFDSAPDVGAWACEVSARRSEPAINRVGQVVRRSGKPHMYDYRIRLLTGEELNWTNCLMLPCPSPDEIRTATNEAAS